MRRDICEFESRQSFKNEAPDFIEVWEASHRRWPGYPPRSRSRHCYQTSTRFPQATVLELKKLFHIRKRKFYLARQRFTLQPEKGKTRGIPLEDDKTLESYKLKDGSTIIFKDLGPQVTPPSINCLALTSGRLRHGILLGVLGTSPCIPALLLFPSTLLVEQVSVLLNNNAANTIQGSAL